MFRRYPCAHSFLMLITPLMLIAMLIVTASGARAMTPSLEPSCTGTYALELNSVARGYSAPRETNIFTLDVPTAGILALDVAVPGYAEASPKLGLLGPDCSPLTDSLRALVIERSTVHQVLAIGPGTYHVRLAAQDPQAALGSFKLTTAFVASAALDGALKTDTDMVDPDPGIAAITPSFKVDTDIVDPDPGLTWVEPSFKVDTDIVDPDPGLASPEQGQGFPELCRQQLDEHADTFTCATELPIGRQVDAEIGVELDDADVFTFTLTQEETIRIGRRACRRCRSPPRSRFESSLPE